MAISINPPPCSPPPCTVLLGSVTVSLNQFPPAQETQPSSHLITCWPRVPAIGENLTLTCMVEKFYPKDITLTWLKNGLPIQRSTQFGPFSCERSFFSVWSQMSFPLTKDDEGHVYTCQINHSSFRKIKELSYEINLKGTPPEVLWITADPDPPQLGKELRLSCRINNYSPENISVKWLRNEQILHHGTCNSSSAVSANGLHSMWSVLKCLPDRDDHLSMFVCKVEHVASKTCEERSYTLQLFSKCTVSVHVILFMKM
ncbi:signal-regulatory protein beta-1-like [Ambystoma mexicanum]|uniref:signal-regulatory protein beta-1-like n=1 Tax=Ambystoma mexicanum TaxID=8296 RepID=UPI0037E9AA76